MAVSVFLMRVSGNGCSFHGGILSLSVWRCTTKCTHGHCCIALGSIYCESYPRSQDYIKQWYSFCYKFKKHAAASTPYGMDNCNDIH